MPNQEMKGLVIDEPWIAMILRGEKTWEMRKTACHHRGTIALIRKGSGHVVGIAEIVDSLPPIKSATAYAETEQWHRIPPSRQAAAFSDGWKTPWVLRNARPLPKPVPYQHPNGAVIWVNLDHRAKSAIQSQDRPPLAMASSASIGNIDGSERINTVSPSSPVKSLTIAKAESQGSDGLHAVVRRGKAAGTILFPHLHGDGCYVVSPSRFEKDYIRVRSIEEAKEHLRRGYSLRMSNPENPNHRAPSLIASASVKGWK